MRIWSRISACVLCIFCLVYPGNLRAADDDSISFDAGIKSVYSSGISPANMYYRPFAGISFTIPAVKITPIYSRYQHYQITDGYGNYRTLDYNQPGLGLTLSPFECLELTGEYRYAFGDSQYRSYDYSAGLTFLFESISLMTSLNVMNTSYDFGTERVRTEGYSYSMELDYNVSDSVSIDAGCEFKNVYFSNLDYSYNLRLFRMGIMPELLPSLFMIGGVSLGMDSSKYCILGGDTGISARLFGVLKISTLYALSYYGAPDAISGDTGSGPSSPGHGRDIPGGGTSGRVNPYLRNSYIGKSFYSHALSLGISCSF